jgi:hypothetical protein
MNSRYPRWANLTFAWSGLILFGAAIVKGILHGNDTTLILGAIVYNLLIALLIVIFLGGALLGIIRFIDAAAGRTVIVKPAPILVHIFATQFILLITICLIRYALTYVNISKHWKLAIIGLALLLIEYGTFLSMARQLRGVHEDELMKAMDFKANDDDDHRWYGV